jgi:hypothetical protein
LIRAADLSGDGKADLAMITAANTLSVLVGDGLGGFGPVSKLSTGGVVPKDFVLADFSGDGRTDIAVANSASNTVGVLTANPDFTFGAPLKLHVGVKPQAIGTGDFDGDGRADLVVAHGISRFVSVLLNATAGSTTGFQPQIKIGYRGVNAPSALSVADVDLDGRDDIVLANTATGSVGVFLNTGAATFRLPIFFDLDNTPARKPSAIALSDLNGDGRLDFAVTNAATSDVSLLYRIII